jgi:hypothetical protein
MRTTDLSPVLSRLFSELVDGASDPTGAFILNSRDVGLLRSLDKLSADDASRSVNDGATIAAHAQHVRYGLSLMNRWANDGANPFADAKWDEAWKTFDVDATEWEHIRNGVTSPTSSLAGWSRASLTWPITSAPSGKSTGLRAGQKRERSRPAETRRLDSPLPSNLRR